MRVLMKRASYAKDGFRRSKRDTSDYLFPVYFVLGVLCVLGLVMTLVPSRSVPESESEGPEHILVFDCGSTGTRLNIIRNEGGTLVPVDWQEFDVPWEGYKAKKHGYHRLETLGGIHGLAGKDLEAVKGALQPMLDWAGAALSSRKPSEIPILLFATAGVRKLSKGGQDALMRHVRHVLSSTNFKFQEEWAKIITGEDEGIFSWVSSNYKLGNFERTVASSSDRGSPGMSMNMLELGGSSLQVSYVVDAPAETARTVEVLGRDYNLQVKSFNGYGMNDAFNSTLTHLRKRWDGGKGGERKSRIAHPCLQKGYTLKEADVSFDGDFDAEECERVIEAATHSEVVQRYAKSMRNAKTRFIALAGFYLVYSFFDLDLKKPLSEVVKHANAVCEQSYDSSLSREQREDLNSGLYCFRSTYILAISRWLSISDQDIKVFDSSEWALGAGIQYLAFLMPRHEGWKVGWLLGVSGILLLAGLVVGGWARKGRSANGLLPVFFSDKHP